MDYEKAYKEALSRAKSAINECGDNKGRIAMIESIFPELAESEEYVTHWEKGDKNSRFWRCQTIDNHRNRGKVE